MATFIPGDTSWHDAGVKTGEALTSSFMNRADQVAIQNSVSKLPKNASAREVLDAVTNTNTYSPAAKKEALTNYVGIENLELERKKIESQKEIATFKATKKAEEIKAKQAAKQIEKDEKQKADDKDVQALGKVLYPDSTPEEIKEKTAGLTPTSIRSLITKPESITDYEIAKNHASRIDPQIKQINTRAEEAEKLLPATESAIISNEKYTLPEKYWDTLISIPNNSWLNVLKTKTGQQLEAYTPIAIGSFSAKMGGVLSVKKIATIEKKAVSPIKDKETNRLFLYMDLYDRRLDQLTQKFSNEILEKSKYGLAPSNFDQELKKKMKPYREQIDKNIGVLLDDKIPKDELSKLSIQWADTPQKTPEGRIRVRGPDGKPKTMDAHLLGQPGYEGYVPYESE